MTAVPIHRRHFLVGAAGVVGGAAVISDGPAGMGWLAARALAEEAKPLPDYASWKNAAALIVHSNNTIETRREFVGPSSITPNDILYVRNNLSPPPESAVADPDAWEVAFEGVGAPATLTLGALKRMGVTIGASVLQCSGNGRGLFDHEASGTQWQTGAAGCVLWSGVPLKTVVDQLGGPGGGTFITATGGETLPEGIDPKTVIVERSVPVAALEDAILAWEMNGQPLPLAHGGPLRIVFPGYYGVNNVKYVKRVALTETESDAAIQATGYRVRPVGVDGAPDQPSMWEMKVKSWVTHPLADSASGQTQIYGVAFSGQGAIDKVEVTTDGGKTWKEASLIGPDLGRFGWRVFALAADLTPGEYVIASRATDSAGNVQPEVTEPNHRGYDYSGWSRLAIDVTVA